MKKGFLYDTSFGKIGLIEEDGMLTELLFNEGDFPECLIKEETPLLKKAYQQLERYFKGQSENFELPLRLKGTDFQIKVWQALQTIPYGEVRTYKDIAEQIGHPKAFRAVGNANNKNPIAIIVPCHRVVASGGKLGGYGGGILIKEKLLKLEGIEGLS